MKVNKHGDIIKKRTHKFKCYNCGCKYTADNGEWYYANGWLSVKRNKPTDYVASKCPECDKTNNVQWRGKLRDWWKENWGLLFALIGVLSVISLIIFGMLDSITGSVISGITAFITLIIARCSIQ